MKQTFVAAHGLIKRGDRFLVTFRAKENDYIPEVWDVPGGTIEFGEDIKKALQREIFEEVNLKIKPGKILLAFGYLNNPSRHQFQLVYECEYISGQIKLNPKEHSRFRWIEFSEMKKLKKIAFLEELYNEFKNRL